MSKKNDYPNSNSIRFFVYIIGIITFLTLDILLENSKYGVILLDSKNSNYPFTIQIIIWFFLFIGLGELFVRLKIANWENKFIHAKLLPENNEILQNDDLAEYRKRIAGNSSETINFPPSSERGFVPYLINLSISQFQTSHSVDQTVVVFNNTLELISNKIELRYSFTKYITWLIPTIGFIGTVIGISDSLSLVKIEKSKDINLEAITSSLGLAFNTTLVALMLSAGLVFLLQYVQKKEESSLIDGGDYILKNLINRLYTGK